MGANIGTHSVAFARDFAQVHAFEPNSALWPSFERHMALNNLKNVQLHKVGLSDREEILPFYLTEHDNMGLGTAAPDQVYDVPLRLAGTIRVVHGDTYLSASGAGVIDFVKIDVQGLEMLVLRGLAGTLSAHHPYVWLEVNEPTLKEVGSVQGLSQLMPFPAKLFKFEHAKRGLRNTVRIKPATEQNLKPGDYVFAPVDRA